MSEHQNKTSVEISGKGPLLGYVDLDGHRHIERVSQSLADLLLERGIGSKVVHEHDEAVKAVKNALALLEGAGVGLATDALEGVL